MKNNRATGTDPYVPKNVQLGQKVRLHFGQRGELFITFEVINEVEKITEKAEFMIDTGFNGYLQLHKDFVSKLKLNIKDKAKSTGFDGSEKEVGVIKTKIKILDQEVWNFPIQVVEKGPFLIGTNLLKDLNKMLIIDYRNGILTITDQPKVQKKVHKTVEKYQR